VVTATGLPLLGRLLGRSCWRMTPTPASLLREASGRPCTARSCCCRRRLRLVSCRRRRSHICELTLHYGKQCLCRVPQALPSGKPRALGKEALCRVPDHALGKDLFAECLALGKEKHSAKRGTRQRGAWTNVIRGRPLCRVPCR